MVLEICVFTETSVADVTFERPRSVVYVHVRFEISGCRKRFRTQTAFVRFFLNMSHPMVVKVRTGGESFTAYLTLMRFFSAVYSAMSVQRTRS